MRLRPTAEAYKSRNTEGHFDYSYDSSENLVKISCYIKGEKKPYYRFEYFYNEKGNISRMDWFNWNGELEMY
ncbi:MAG TPA: hypothetical protein PK467_15305, partial [Candidatus Wallbacteria bacterium]|nr:hypothetical protein [Candidatus Wallbacteria bacterium]